MQTLVDEISEKAFTLSPEERARLAEKLLASLHEGTDTDVEEAWGEEIRRRLTEIENGTAKLVPAEEVFAEIRRMLK